MRIFQNEKKVFSEISEKISYWHSAPSIYFAYTLRSNVIPKARILEIFCVVLFLKFLQKVSMQFCNTLFKNIAKSFFR